MCLPDKLSVAYQLSHCEDKVRIFILHPGKANYPEISAYRNYLASRFEVLDGTEAEYLQFPHKRESILWCLMGFIPVKLDAKYVIHDYRSLSTGRMCAIKDWLKKTLNTKPSLRIFQNSKMSDVMDFRDNIPEVLLPMGVPDWIPELRLHGSDDGVLGTYCYIGEMSFERKFDRMLEAFLAYRNSEETLLLVGSPEERIRRKYSSTEGLIFTGRLPQPEALQAVLRSSYAISFFPYHRPHCFQAPTKLLEYAALGMRIIANDSPGNTDTISQLGISAVISSPYIFDSDQLRDNLVELQPTLNAGTRWMDVISKSGIDGQLSSLLV